MARLGRVVIPGLPHHVAQRGNGRARTFFGDEDYAFYRDLLSRNCRAAGVEIWARVLTPNHLRLILNPSDPDGLRRALAPARRYAGRIHARQKKTGHFWQGRFGAVTMDEAHLAAAVRHVAMNPVRARLVAQAQDWPWSSAKAHLSGQADGVTWLDPVRGRFANFADLLDDTGLDALQTPLRQAEAIGRLPGAAAFLDAREAQTGRRPHPNWPGRKPKALDMAEERDIGALSP